MLNLSEWLIILCDAAGSHDAESTVFLPTKCMVLLDTLVKARPFHCILAADYDHLPETRILGKNAPLAATTVSPVPFLFQAILNFHIIVSRQRHPVLISN